MDKIRKIKEGWANDKKDKEGKLDPALKELFDSRLKICKTNKCHRLIAGICSACGCPVRKKTKVVGEECPENMWEPIKYEINGREFILVVDLPDKLQVAVYESGIFHIISPEPTGVADVVGIYWEDWQKFLLSIDSSEK